MNDKQSKICPQRVLREALRIIENHVTNEGLTDNEAEAIDNNILELEEVIRRLDSAGIINL